MDLHSHILPGLDDGSPDLATSMAMLEGLISLGFSTVCATPHQKTGQYLPSLSAIAEAHTGLLKAVAERQWPLSIPLAAENMWDETLYQRMQDDAIPGYQGSRVFLLEFVPSHLPMGVFERIFELRCAGFLPVVAHPERYTPLWDSPDLMDRLASECVMVVDLAAVAGDNGRKQAKVSRKMILEGLAHAAASDLHCVADLKSAKKGMAWIRKKAGEATLERLLASNPRKILEGTHPG